MTGYEVVTSDESKVGEVVEIKDDLLIVESGLLRKHRHAVPTTFAHPDEGEQVVRLTVSKELVEESPKVDDGVDRKAVAQHYGLAEGDEAPATQGAGELEPDDPAIDAEQQGRRVGIESATERTARIREGGSEAGPRGRPTITSSDEA